MRRRLVGLAGVRRGHVSIACSQALLPYFLPREISRYRGEHPGVTFTVNARDRVAAERELSEFASDIALVFEPLTLVDFEVIYAINQPIHAIMRADHPLAEDAEIRLRDALRFPHIAPSETFAVRILLENAARRLASAKVNPLIESESFDFMRRYGEWEDMISFQFPIGLDMAQHPSLVARPLSVRDVVPGNLLLGQLRGRTLPVASARFMRELVHALQEDMR